MITKEVGVMPVTLCGQVPVGWRLNRLSITGIKCVVRCILPFYGGKVGGMMRGKRGMRGNVLTAAATA